jgi:beta-lactamase regulating signal transducer with metallopeptidase domain/tetratricopeptide (TPR) repeat protein
MSRLNEIALSLQNSEALTVLLVLLAKVTLIAVIGRLVMLAVPRASASTRYLIAVTTFLSMLAVPVVSATGLQWHLSVLPAERLASPPREASAVVDVVDVEPAETGASTPVSAFEAPAPTIRDTWRGWLVLATLLVGAALIGRMAFGVLAIAWITSRAHEIEDDMIVRDFDVAAQQLGVTRFVRLMVTDRVSVPLMWGVSSPVLLLPAAAAEWSRDRLRVVFLHELAHLRRGDVITLLLTRATAALYWFHPIAWSLDRAARRECEQACDDLVLTAGTRASDYADHLLEIARALPGRDPFGSVTLAMSRRSQLEGRLLSILQADARRGTPSKRNTAFAFVMAGLLTFPIATVNLTAQPIDEKGTSVTSSFTGTLSRAVVAAVARTVSAMSDQSDGTANGTRVTEWKTDEPENISSASMSRSSSASASSSASGAGGDEGEGGAGDNGDHEKDKWRRSDNDDDYIDRAKEAFSNKDWERSILEYKKAIEAGQRPTVAMYNIACAYARAGVPDSATDWLEKAIENGFNDAELIAEDSDLDSIRMHPRFASIVKKVSRNKYEKKSRATIEQFEYLRTNSASDSGQYCEVGKRLLKMRDLPRAIAAFNEGVRLDPSNGTCRYNLACAYALSGENGRALQMVESAIHNNASVGGEHILEDPDLVSIRGARLEELADLADDLQLRSDNEWRSEIPHYAVIAKKYPNIPRAQFNHGFALVSSGKSREAIEVFTKLLGTGYRPGTVMYNIACAYAIAGDRQNAVSWLMKADRAGFKVGEYAKGDQDLISVRDDKWVAEQIAQAYRRKFEEDKDK